MQFLTILNQWFDWFMRKKSCCEIDVTATYRYIRLHIYNKVSLLLFAVINVKIKANANTD